MQQESTARRFPESARMFVDYGQYTTDWGPIGAALVLATFPTLFIYIFLSKKIQDSFVAGAVKG